MSDDLRKVLEVLRGDDDESGRIVEVALAAGDEIHQVLKRHAVAMPTVRGAIAVGLHVTAQMLCETVEFGQRSVEGGSEESRITEASFALFRELVEAHHPTAFGAARGVH